MTRWEAEKAWSDKFQPEIKAILGQYVVRAASLEEDRLRNTDLIVFRGKDIRISCRMRRASYISKYGNQFTLRSATPGGGQTELAKVLEGWGDCFFYGFGEDRLIRWVLGDLHVFRDWYSRELACWPSSPPGQLLHNHDGSSDFRAFLLSDLPSAFIIAQNQ
jgi:hypothetical protein